MTTTVCDLVNKIITADTRWSCGSQGELVLSDGNPYLVYCDDTGFDKITVVGKTALVTAGHGGLIAAWKQWWAGDADPKSRPATHIDGENAVNVAIIDLENNKVIFDAGQKLVLFCTNTNRIKAFTAGSGASHAASDLLINGCAKQAIGYASRHDYCTGEIVSFACYRTVQDNLNSSINDYDVIVEGITTKGYVMALSIDKPSDTGCEISLHPLSAEIKTLFSTGKAVASAPVPGVGSFQWTEETDAKFEAAMQQVHHLRQA
ncbi:hypothetical protein M2366_002152 [Aeromonas sp. BIGb0405]|uniref:hypothetical protein n=1 Tax=Aeromonas sp. BIGb0405 TaxID=2940592 RepID=UPI0021697107|nr:hypothetical protein [Aeromonas sp. BIGb0405]MCS3456071.1 hypothetical protein [Aeromonas sp. BIGb0405]